MMGHTEDTGADTTSRAGDADIADEGADRRPRAPDPRLPRLLVDFNRLGRRADGVEVIDVGGVDEAGIRGRSLADGMFAVFEEPGELQMTGVLRRATGPAGDYWQGELEGDTLIYHVRIAEQSLYFAGPEGCVRYMEYYRRAADETTSEAQGPARAEGGAAPSAVSGAEGAEDREPHEEREDQWDVRPQAPAAALTLGVEGTFEQWYRALAGTIPSGESVLAADGEPIVLVDGEREVDARMRVLHLPPELVADSPAAGRASGVPPSAFPRGRRVWLAEPDWNTLRRIPWARHARTRDVPAKEMPAEREE